jgi:putative transposase
MTRKWSNKNLPGALHFITGNLHQRVPVFRDDNCCQAFIDVCAEMREQWPFKLIAYVLMPDHIHLVVNPRDGRVRELTGKLKSQSARRIVAVASDVSFTAGQSESGAPFHQVWQESFKALPLWSDWMIWQKINYIHSNPLKARLVKSAADYRWSSYSAFYSGGADPIPLDREWWWPDDVRKLAEASTEWVREIEAETKKRR